LSKNCHQFVQFLSGKIRPLAKLEAGFEHSVHKHGDELQLRLSCTPTEKWRSGDSQNATLIIATFELTSAAELNARSRLVFFYTPAAAALTSGGVRRASAAWPKYNRYERWIPYMTGKTTKAACQPK